jgi:hypothetical protein
VRAANEKIVVGLEAERQALAQTERERFVDQALSRLSAEATAEQRREVEQLAGALFDEQQALQRASGSWTRAARSSTGPAPPPSCTRPRSRS